MTNFVSLTLDSVSYQLPDGRSLFSNLHETIDNRPTGIVGRNGIGKSVLAAILARELTPTSGRCICSGTIYYQPQQISIRADQTVADLARVRHVINAMDRIERGSTKTEDFEVVGERWDIRQQLQQELTTNRLTHLCADTPVTQLSGGEIMRVALIGAFLSQSDFLILDEPTNHLDRQSRKDLFDQLNRWKSGLVVISHDRALLEHMSRIVELSTLGLRSYGGNYSFYEQTKMHERANAAAQLEQRKAERKRAERELHEQRERQERRQARGKKQAKDANQAKILLGRQKERSEISGSKLRVKQQATQHALALRVQDAAQFIEDDAPIVLYAQESNRFSPHKIAELDSIILPFVDMMSPVNLTVTRGQRIGVVGTNGSGKSTLLRVLAGDTSPINGRCEVAVKAVYLDQHLATLHADKSTLDQLLLVNRQWGVSLLRTRLAQLGLKADRVDLPFHLLSGGERLKGALACALYADQPAQLLLLDEPSNHLDIASIQALETMLCQYSGTLIIASHDEAFLHNIELTHRFTATADSWQLSIVSTDGSSDLA